MIRNYLLFGVIAGILFGIPAGAIGVLSIQRGIKSGSKACFITGMGSSTVDVIYAAIGVYGLSFISNWLFQYQTVISIIGSGFIILMGIITIKSKKHTFKEKDEKVNYMLFYLSSVFIAIMNPATIISFLAIFTMFEIGKFTNIEGVKLVLGIFIGTGIWWSVLSIIVKIVKEKITAHTFDILNKILGIIMIVIGTVMIVRQVIA